MLRFFRVRHHIFVALVFACSVAPLPAQSAPFDPLPASDGKWRHFRSPNFELYSRENDDQSRDLLHKLEMLRTVFIDNFKLVERRRQEVTVFYFTREKDFRPYLPKHLNTKVQFSAYYTSNSDRAAIVLGPAEDRDSAREIVFHEYIHHLFRVSGENPPLWINEGMAELFSTIKVTGTTLEFGRASRGRLFQLHLEKMMSLEQLFASDHNSSMFSDESHTGIFYAQSWALMHYWHFGQSHLPAEKIDQFLFYARLEPALPGAVLRARFREAFGMDYPEMEKRLENYTTSGRYTWRRMPQPVIDPPTSYSARSVPAEEARLRLAELALRVNRTPLAKLVLLDAVQNNSKDPRPYEALGADALRDGDELIARERWQQAVDAGTRNPAIYRELGRVESRAWFPQFDVYFRLPAEKADRLRGLLLKSIELSPDQTDGYEMLAWVEAFSPTPGVQNINLVQGRFDKLKQKELTLLAFALVRHRVGDNPTALEMLGALENAETGGAIRFTVEELRAKIEGRAARRIEQGPMQRTIPMQIRRMELPGKP